MTIWQPAQKRAGADVVINLKGYGFSAANNFVWNLKIKPSAIDKFPLRYRLLR
jgi:hypothetical protein